MEIKLFQIDAFTDKLFSGNPAAVCPLDHWLEDELLLQIAQENNLSETAYFIPLSETHFHLRWFTPEFEMDLCGHATLASAFVIFDELKLEAEEITFETLSGTLGVKKSEGYLALNFPMRPPIPAELPEIIQKALNIQPKEVWKARDYLLVFESEDDVRSLEPNIALLNKINLDPGGIIVSSIANDSNVDFVSRFFTPQASIPEDPVTGSAHCTLVPFWANRLGKTKLNAKQISKRGGNLICNLESDRVELKGKAVKYMEGVIQI